MSDTIATDPDIDNQGTEEVTLDSTQDTGVAAETGTVDTDTSSGEDDSSLTTPDGSESTESALGRFEDQLRNRSKQTPDPNEVKAPAAETAQAALSLQQVQEKLGIKTPEDLKRFENQTSLFGRQANELGQLRKQLSDLQQERLAERQRQEEQAAKANLSPFHANHPQYHMNEKRIERASNFLAAVEALPPEQQANKEIIARMAQRMGVNNQDVELAHQSREYRENTQRELASNPESFVETRADRIIQKRLAEFESYLNNRYQAQNFVQQHQDLINDPRSQEIMAKALDEGTSRSDLAVELAKITRERDELLKRAHKDTAEVETLKAKDELASRQTVTSRRASSNTHTQPDPWKSYEEKKHDPTASEKLLENLLKRRA